MKIQELQDKPHGDICAKLYILAPQVLEAKQRYDELMAEQRLYLAARTLQDAGVRLGDKVRLRGSWAGKKDPLALVVGAGSSDLIFQVLRKDGQPHGDAQYGWMFDGFERVDE